MQTTALRNSQDEVIYTLPNSSSSITREKASKIDFGGLKFSVYFLIAMRTKISKKRFLFRTAVGVVFKF